MIVDPYDFMAFICLNLKSHLKVQSKDLICNFHKELCDLVQYDRAAACAPRSFAKSTYLCFFYSLYLLNEIPGCGVVLVGASALLSQKWSIKIRRELESNKLLQARYGDQTGGVGLKWTNESIELANGSSLEAYGYGQKIRGIRKDRTFIIVDDIEDDEMVVSEERRKDFDKWFDSTLTNILQPGMQMIWIGTLLHPESALAEVINKGKEGWNTRHYAAITAGRSIWPEMWPLEELYKRKAQIGTYAFEQEFQNNPIPDEMRKFQKKWFKYYDKLPARANYYLSVDPAIKTHDKADYTAMVVVAVDMFDNWYVVSYTRRKLLPKETVDLMFQYYQRYNLQAIGIEEIAFQEMLIYEVKEQRNERNLWPIIKPIKNTGVRKELRIESLQPRYESGKIYHKTGMDELELELLRFPSPRCHDDLIDALSAVSKMAHPVGKAKDKIDPNSFEALLEKRRARLQLEETEYDGVESVYTYD